MKKHQKAVSLLKEYLDAEHLVLRNKQDKMDILAREMALSEQEIAGLNEAIRVLETGVKSESTSMPGEWEPLKL